MKIFLLVIYLIDAVAVILLILSQGRGGGMGSAWGGSTESFSTRRGVERLTFIATILSVSLFLVLSIVNLFV
ncbi:preprotein translocase subunit SecG [Candidatus Roizmanbacteria bacterium CG10_big_fil_rev_8_21_14_0_10_45_7]|uniref:Protein-export membrane protein SecG n=1 Tax=Candidatus Roizmanbacteria bacterium CG10_big_fil_rev_8_21_14_0_10_45_7 TaxID=1974854 RepID=A0A2M8KV30_9BACT|nr:MAG: preprotein translocase subunit SecG [Candidatus Roizmanbacteria bacterium CG10_big_fil_rev_8_21_14_0_10_45_7]